MPWTDRVLFWDRLTLPHFTVASQVYYALRIILSESSCREHAVSKPTQIGAVLNDYWRLIRRAAHAYCPVVVRLALDGGGRISKGLGRSTQNGLKSSLLAGQNASDPENRLYFKEFWKIDGLRAS